MRVAFTRGVHHIVLTHGGKGHISRINSDDDAIYFEYDEEEAKVTKVVTEGADINGTLKSAIAGAIRRHQRAQKVAAEVDDYDREG